jgi:hypothetical protein
LKPVTFIARLPLPAFDAIFDRTAARLTKLTNARLSPDHGLFKTPPHLLPQERSQPTGDFVSRLLAPASSETIRPAGRGRQVGGFDASAGPARISEMHGQSD